MNNFRLSFLLLVLITTFASCKKDNDPAPPTKTELLTAKPWKLTAFSVSPALPDSIFIEDGTGSFSDILGFYSSKGVGCFNDNQRIFTKPKSFSYNQGATKCDASGAIDYASGNWALSLDEKSLFLTFTNVPTSTNINDIIFDWSIPNGGNVVEFTVTELTATSLKYTYAIGQFTFTETLSNQ
jgi:hypothetical protein